MTKNIHETDTPEWQLFERAKAADHAAKAFDADAVRYQQMAAKKRDEAEAFWAAYHKVASHD